MNSLRIAVVPAFAFALALPASVALAHGVSSPSAATTEPVAQAQAEQQVPETKDAIRGNPEQAPGTDKQRAQKKGVKHPPTAIMDRATPTDKSTSEKGASTKHPPTSAMDRAAPEQKSPESDSANAPDSSRNSSGSTRP